MPIIPKGVAENKGSPEPWMCLPLDAKGVWDKMMMIKGSSESIVFTYVGLSIRSYRDGITVDQNKYIVELAQIPISKKRASQIILINNNNNNNLREK